MTDTLRVAPEVARDVLDHALETTPHECCGVLLGPEDGHATRVIRADNVHANPRTEYEVDPDTLFEAVQRAEKSEAEVVGFYHSHPRGPAAFSDTDRARGSWEGAAYLLVCLKPVAFLAGRWDGEAFADVDVVADVER